MDNKDVYFSPRIRSYSSSSSRRDVSYSCGSCGYELNLCSSKRNTSTIGSKYGKSIKKGILSFFHVDESRFTVVDEILCRPHLSKHSWGMFHRRTKLLCRKCGNCIGNTHHDHKSTWALVSDGVDVSSPSNGSSTKRKYDIKISALQPSSSSESGVLQHM